MPIGRLALFVFLAASDFDRGVALYHQRSYAQAEQALRRAVAAKPHDPKARLYLARTLIQQNRVAEALAQIEPMLAKPPGADIGLEAGQLFRELAEQRAQQLAAAAPDSAAVHEMAGERLELAGKLPAALDEYNRAASLEPARPGIHYRLGNVLWRSGQPEAAEAALRKELERNPHHGTANLRLGQLLLSQGRDAVTILERAATAMPENAEARRELGKAYRKAGRNADARRVWEQVAEAKPNDSQIHFLLGGLYRELGEPALSRAALEKHQLLLRQRRAQSETRAK